MLLAAAGFILYDVHYPIDLARLVKTGTPTLLVYICVLLMCHRPFTLLRLDASPAGMVDKIHAAPHIVVKSEEERDDEGRFGKSVCHSLVHKSLQGKHSLHK